MLSASDAELVIQDAVAEMRDRCSTGDPEHDHVVADQILLRTIERIGIRGSGAIAAEFREVSKWYA